jgi:hypothetical protein
VDDSLPLEHIILMLQRSPEQDLALTTRIDQMHNQRSPYYHQWLKAEDVGGCYGVADSDIATVTGWLESHGFKIDMVPAGKTLIIFSGTAGQVREAFHTEIHNLNVRGEQHIANMSEPQIPAALAPVIAGFRSLHNFFPKPLVHVVGPIQRDSKTGKWHKLAANKGAADETAPPNSQGASPLISWYSDDIWAVGPQDFYTIYNETPLLTASTRINGAGQTLAIVQDSEVNPADVTAFRSQFGLPPYPATPNATQGGVNYMFGISSYCSGPGTPDKNGGESEADIDVQWMGATAPAAIIDFVACADTASSFGGDLSAQYVVNNLDSTVSAFSLSFGWCEAELPWGNLGLAANSFYNNLWEQAVAEGQTPVIAAGDSGDDVCDRGNNDGPYNNWSLGENGLSVNGLASTPYNVAAGGTDFSDSYQTDFNPTSYWNKNDTSPYDSALSYIPETAWNNTCANPLLVDFLRYHLGITYPNGAEGLCNENNLTENGTPTSYMYTTLDGAGGGSSTLYSLPTWQSVYGIGPGFFASSNTNRNLPDISLFASDGGLWNHMLVFCESDLSPCTYAAAATASGAGGTSFVAPMLGGIMGLINQAWPSGDPAQPTRQGQANYTFYGLAAAEYGTYGYENTSTTAPSIYTCEGSSINAIGTYSSIFPSCIFHDIYRTPQYGSSSCAGASGNNTVCLVDNNAGPCAAGSTDCYTNTSGDAYGILSTWYTRLGMTAVFPAFEQYAGYSDATGLGSVNIDNLVKQWTSVTTQFASTTTLVASPTSITTTASTTLTATVTATGRGSLAPPLGDVNFYRGSSCSGTALGSANLVPATACTTSCNATASLPGITGAQLGVGTPSVVACFSGDGANDAPSTSPAVTVTVTASSTTATTTTLTLAPTSVTVGSSGPVEMTAKVAPTTGTGTPTGSVNFFVNGGTAVGSGTLSSGTATFNYNPSTLAVGPYPVTAQYGGDTNFSSSTSTAQQLTVTASGTTATPTFSPATGTYTSAQSVTISDTTPSSTIYYTTNGTTPTTSSTQYSGPITVAATETIEALATATGDANSSVATATYTINPPGVAATPTFFPVAGTYASAQSVTISDSTSGAAIYYTVTSGTTGTTPTTSSTQYSGPITVAATETIEAIAVATGYSSSAVATATYTINLPGVAAVPTFLPAAGTYSSAQSVTISDTTPSSTIYYTTNGTTPTTSSTLYTGPITVSATETIEALATATGDANSSVATATYTITTTPNFTVTASPASLTVTAGQSGTVTVSVTPQNAFASAVSFTCSGLPTGASCSFSPATVTPSGAAASTTLTVSTSATMAAVRRNFSPLFPGTALAAALCFLGLKKRRSVQLLLLLAVSVIGLSLFTGCGGGSSSRQPPVTATVTVTGTSGTGANVLQNTAQFSLTVNSGS